MFEKILQIFRRHVTQRISIKLTLILGALIVVLIGSTGLVLTRVTQDVLRKNLEASHREIARQTAGEVALFVSRPVELLTLVAQMVGRTHLEAHSQETVLVEMSLRYPMFKEILSVNSEGKEIASSNPGYPVKDWANDESFRKALEGNKYISPVRIGADHLPYVRVALPYWQSGKKAGVLLAQVNLRGIWDIVDKVHIGETGILFLISKDGLVVAHPDRRLVFKNVNIKRYPVLRNLALRSEESVEFTTRKGKSYLASYVPVESLIPLSIIVQIETAEAYQLVRRLKSLISLVLCFSVLIYAAVGFFLARKLVKPVKSLQYWSKKISLGDFDFHIPPKSSDELGRLFITFKRMSERLKAARERERLAALGEMATSISHKLKNSIVSLKTFAQILPQRKQNEKFMERFEEKFSFTVEHLEKVLANLSLMTSSNVPHHEVLDLAVLLESLKDQYMEIVEDNRIQFQVEAEAGMPEFRGNREQLTELFSNLIQNAIQAMPDGGKLNVKSFYLSSASLIRITVSDTGPGIPPEYAKNIFKPFFTTKHGGMGLGLSISKKIVEDHHGSLNLIHHDERGCLFQIFFPVNAPAPAVAPVPARTA